MKAFFQFSKTLFFKPTLAIGIIFLLSASNSWGQTINTWDGSSSNNWNTAANWSLNSVPTNAHDVVINMNAAILVDATTTINKLTVTNNATVSFTSSGGGRIITIDNTGSSIQSGSKLTLQGSSGSGTRSMTIAFSGSSRTMSIAGSLILPSVGEGAVYSAANSITTVSGNLTSSADGAATTPTITSTSSNLIFTSTAVYEHKIDGGTIPTATWATTSTCSITNTNTDVSGLDGQTLGNFTYNCPSQTGRCDLESTFTVAGKFLVQSTGTSHLCITNTDNETITVADFEITGGTFRFSDDNAATGVLNVSGNFTVSGGTIDENTTLTNCAINFNGSSQQIFTSGGSVSGDINFTVGNGSTLQMAAASTVVHGRSFTLSSDGTLDIKSADGISKFVSAASDSSKGNIRTLNRTYNTNANYIYSGAAQTIGNGLTGARNLTLSGSGRKTFAAANFTSNNLGVAVDLNINTGVDVSIPNGNSITVSQKLYLGGVGKANGTYGSTTSSATNKDNTYFAATTGFITATLSALPVTLSSFTAKPTTDNKVSLGWVTSTEQVNKGFRIERQAGIDNGKYEQIGFVGSKAKDGNSQNTLYYNFIDAAPKAGTASLYRLVQEDLDGKLTYSEVRVVKLNGQSVSMVFPNPSNGAVNISRTADGKKMNIQVIDQSGRIVSQVSNITDANYRMNLPQSGIYSIKMMYPETGEQSIQRIVVQK